MTLRSRMIAGMALVCLIFAVALGVAVSGMRQATSQFTSFLEQDQAFLSASNTLYAQGLQMGQALRNVILAPGNEQGYKKPAPACRSGSRAAWCASSAASRATPPRWPRRSRRAT